MCKAMKTRLLQRDPGRLRRGAAAPTGGGQAQRSVKEQLADDAAFILGNAETVVIVPGLRPGRGGARPARREGTGREADPQGHHGEYAIHRSPAACRAT